MSPGRSRSCWLARVSFRRCGTKSSTSNSTRPTGAAPAGREALMPRLVGRRAGELVVVARDQRYRDAGERLGVAQRAGEDMEPVGPGEAGEADIGLDQPLDGDLAAVVVAVLGLGLC